MIIVMSLNGFLLKRETEQWYNCLDSLFWIVIFLMLDLSYDNPELQKRPVKLN